MAVDERPPRLWLLLGRGTGGNGLMRSLARELGWPVEEKQLVYNWRSEIPNLLLGASTLGLDRHRSAPLTAPWPDVVIAASRRSAPVARWIRHQSGGRTCLIHLLHAQVPLHRFDLVVTMPQFRLPEAPNVLHLTAPLNRPDPQAIRAAVERWRDRIEALPAPRIALLVGGNSSSYTLDTSTAARLGREASAAAREKEGSLLVTTSPRTPAEAAEALMGAIEVPALRYRWQPGAGAENPYLAYLALADEFIVTADSASLLVEACIGGRPTHLFDWGTRRASVLGSGNGRGIVDDIRDRAVYWGLIKPRRDFAAYHRALAERGLVDHLGDSPQKARPIEPLDDMERAVWRIRETVARKRCAARRSVEPVRVVAGTATRA